MPDPQETKTCKYCGKTLPQEAIFCYYCQRELLTRPERPAEEPQAKKSNPLLAVIGIVLIIVIILLLLLR